jgi:exodeoxyribonuclease VII large subunit
LQAAFERLKQKLQAEGLFDQGHKRPLPRYAKSIGLITSPVGAAIRDVIHTIERRDPGLRVVLAPCRVQGPGAAQEIAAAVHLLNDWALENGRSRLDLILVTRGGGSLEDLWAFNEELVARAIYASRLPVISAIGHEIDFTITDFVADLRAATPTAAAEIITEGTFAARPFVTDARARLRDLLKYALHNKREELGEMVRRLNRLHPRRRLGEQVQLLDEFQTSLERCLRCHLRRKQEAWSAVLARLIRARPNTVLQRRRERVLQLGCDLRSPLALRLQRSRDQVEKAESRLRLLSPQNVLNRGYSITMDAQTGKVIRNSAALANGATIRSKLAAGEVVSVVKKG